MFLCCAHSPASRIIRSTLSTPRQLHQHRNSNSNSNSGGGTRLSTAVGTPAAGRGARLSTIAAAHQQPGRRMAAQASLSCPYTELADGLQKLLQLPGPHYVLFTADADPATGVSWCPDCVRCSPAVKNVMADKGAALLEVLVGQRPVWKDQQHPLRHDPKIQLSGVPDVMRWGPEGPTAKMGADLEKAASPAEAVAAVAAFINKTT